MPKVMIVTGTSRGLGRGIAEYYLDQGWLVAGCSRSASTWTREGYCHACVDVGNEEAVVGFVRSVVRTHGRLDALINNAGVAAMNHALLTPVSVFEQTLRTNLLGTFLFSREAAKAMLSHKEGRIVNMSSVAVPLHLEGEAGYAASKAAVENFTRVLAKELGGAGITVNAVGPTPIDTDLIKNVGRQKLDALEKLQAIKGSATVADVCHVLDFFLSEKSRFITGQVVYLGGIGP